MREIEIKTQPSPPLNEISHVSWLEYRKIKRVLDIMLSASFLVIFSPFFLLIALIIKITSPGPVFYNQKRVGKDGKPFDMIKFRTMRNGNDYQIHKDHVVRLIIEDINPLELGRESLKLKSDPRVTLFGKVLRKLGLDELPQFINVLRGEMSIVGPRPSLTYEYEVYNDWHMQRLAVLPGITGLWQVTAHNQVPFSGMVRIDLDYIEKMNLWLDIKIMIKTPFEMLRGKGGG